MAGTDTKEAGRGMRTVCCDPPEAADASSYFPLSERAITRPERGCSITAPMKVVMLFWIQVSDASYLQVHSITRVSSFFYKYSATGNRRSDQTRSGFLAAEWSVQLCTTLNLPEICGDSQGDWLDLPKPCLSMGGKNGLIPF